MALPGLLPPLSPRGRRILLGILAFAFAARVAYLLGYAGDPFAVHPIHDAERYDAWARAWAAGKPFESGPFYQAPLYPFLLSLAYRAFGPSPWTAYVVQCALGVATILLVSRFAQRAYGGSAAVLAAGAAALYGTFVFHETKLLPTSLAVFLIAMLADRLQVALAEGGAGRFGSAGVLLGLAALTNPGALLAAPLVLALLIPRRELRGGLAFAAGIALAVLPVTAGNASRGEAVAISTNGGMTFWQGNNPSAVGVFANPEGFSGAIRSQREESRRLAEAESHRALTDGEVSSFWLHKGLKRLASDPLRTLRLWGAKLGFALASEEQPLEYAPRLDANPARWLMPVPFGIVLGMAALRIGRGRVGREESALLVLLAAQLGVLLLFFVSSRYRMPALPPLLAVAGGGAAAVGASWRRWIPGVLVASVSLAYVPLLHAGLRDTQDAMSTCDRAAVLVASGRRDEGIAAYRRAAAIDPTYPFARLDLGINLRLAGDLTGAEAAARDTVRLAPDLADGWFFLGLVLYEEKSLGEAADAFSKAFRLRPTAESGNNLIGTLMQLGRGDEAVPVWREMRSRGLAVDPPLERWMRERGSPGG